MKQKLAVCYPGAMPTMYASAIESILNIRHPEGYEVKWFRGFGWCQARRRIVMMELALEWGADYIVSLDMDQVYEPDVLERLVAHMEEGHQCVSALVPSRGKSPALDHPFQGCGWKLGEDGEFVPVTPEDGDFVDAEFPTSACNIVAAEVVTRLPKPWFSYGYDVKTWEEVEGEDCRFFWRLRQQLGVTTWIDTTIRVKHCHVFKIDETYSDRFSDWVPGPPGSGY